MADTNYPIPENPQYNTEIRALQDSDPASASNVFNPLFERIIENTHAVKMENERKVADLQAFIGYTDDDTYGVEVDFVNKRFTRLAGATDRTPGEDFDNINAFGGRKRCNVADNGKVNAYYGDVGYSETGSKGQVMVEQPKFYYKVVPLELEKDERNNSKNSHIRKARYYVSDTKKEGFKLHPAFIQNGVEKNFIYLSAYEGCAYDSSASVYDTTNELNIDWSNDLLSSIAGAKPVSGGAMRLSANRPNFRTIAANRGVGWSLQTIQSVSVTQLLFLIEYASFNMQSGIGIGVTNKLIADGNNSLAEITGATANLGNVSGSVTNISGYSIVTYRGEENFFGNIETYIDGINIYNYSVGSVYVADHGFADDTGNSPYQNTGIIISNKAYYISAFSYNENFDWLFMPSECNGSSALPVGDRFMASIAKKTWTGVFFGGNWYMETEAGGFSWNMQYETNSSGANVGARLLYVPQ